VIEMPDFGGNAVTSFPPAGSGRLDPSEIGRRLDCCLFAPLIVYIYIYMHEKIETKLREYDQSLATERAKLLCSATTLDFIS